MVLAKALLVSHHWYDLIIPVLYETIHIRKPYQYSLFHRLQSDDLKLSSAELSERWNSSRRSIAFISIKHLQVSVSPPSSFKAAKTLVAGNALRALETFTFQPGATNIVWLEEDDDEVDEEYEVDGRIREIPLTPLFFNARKLIVLTNGVAPIPIDETDRVKIRYYGLEGWKKLQEVVYQGDETRCLDEEWKKTLDEEGEDSPWDMISDHIDLCSLPINKNIKSITISRQLTPLPEDYEERFLKRYIDEIFTEFNDQMSIEKCIIITPFHASPSSVQLYRAAAQARKDFSFSRREVAFFHKLMIKESGEK